MEQITFSFEGKETTIQCNKNEKMKEICNRYAQQLNREISQISFSSKGNEINENMTINDLLKDMDNNEGKLSILVENSKDSFNEIKVIESKNIICPKCKQNAKIDIKNYKINLYDCKNKHSIKNIVLNDYEDIQLINEDKLICGICNKKVNDNDDFYFCLKCQKNICLICKQNHDNIHIIINYNQKDYSCAEHNEQYISYCCNCEKNMCMMCEDRHNGHNIIYFGKIMPKKENILNDLKELRININKFNIYLNEIITKINNMKEKMEILYKINSDIVNNFEIKNRNYINLCNINNIHKNIISVSKDINSIINDYNIDTKIMNIFKIYKKMENLSEEDDELDDDLISISYKIDINENEVKIFGNEFVQNNKNICKLIYNNEEYDLVENFGNFNHNQEILHIKLKGIKNITNASYMFYECLSFITISNISKWDTSKVTDMRSMFNGCKNLQSLPDLSHFNTRNVKDMYCMFYECSSLVSLPDISQWNTINVKNMSGMFERCSSLIELPDLSNWNTQNVTDMSSMFSKCSMLTRLPDISRWNINNVNDMYGMFDHCKDSLNIPSKFKN